MLDRELVEAVKLAREAGAVLMEVYATDFSSELKEDKSPVTIADRRVNELLVRRLREAFPHDGIVAEESDDKTEGRHGRCWYVDPLDGTKEFIARNGEFSVMIGLAIDGAAKLGVVYKPVGDRLYRGVVGDSAFMESGVETFALGVTDVYEPSDLRLVVSRSHRSEATGELVDALGIQNETKSGSVGLKVGLISNREADLYVHLSRYSWHWDACAPDAILRAAGGCFTDLGGEPFHYGGGELENKRGILACNNMETFHAVLPDVKRIAAKAGLLETEDDAPSASAAEGAAIDPARQTLPIGGSDGDAAEADTEERPIPDPSVSDEDAPDESE